VGEALHAELLEMLSKLEKEVRKIYKGVDEDTDKKREE